MGLRGESSTEQPADTTKEVRAMQKITPCLWFDNQAEEAMNFYVSTFRMPRQEGLRAMERQERRSQGGPKGPS